MRPQTHLHIHLHLHPIPKHLPLQVRENNFRPKCLYVAVMLRRMMEAILNKDTMDDKVHQSPLLIWA